MKISNPLHTNSLQDMCTMCYVYCSIQMGMAGIHNSSVKWSIYILREMFSKVGAYTDVWR